MKSPTGQGNNRLIPYQEVKETALALNLDTNYPTLRRMARALSMVEGVEPVDNSRYQVRSQRHPNISYKVDLGEAPKCTCADWHKHSKGNGFVCKHVIAAMLKRQAEEIEQIELLERQVGTLFLGSNTFVKW